MHKVDDTTNQMVRSVLAYAENRLRMDPVPLDKGTQSPADLHRVLDGVIRDRGRSPDEVLGVYASAIAVARETGKKRLGEAAAGSTPPGGGRHRCALLDREHAAAAGNGCACC